MPLRIRTLLEMLNGLINREDISQLSRSEGLSFDDERIKILEAMQSIDVQACPGSGKTTLIAAKLMLLAKKWPFSAQGICVLSHTNVAKDEIVERLKRSKTPEVQRLLSYPHFIGTIQEFTNRFLALPFIHSKGISEVHVDNDEYVTMVRKLLDGGRFAWIKGTLNGLGNDEKQENFLRETYRLTSEDVNISKKPRAWSKEPSLSKAKNCLDDLKKLLDDRGHFLFRDMYSQANKICQQNPILCKSLAKRFPLVLIDEMQDTQKFQDELLCQVFPLNSPDVVVQRFGDPDQAIFNGTGKEETNVSFNGKQANDMSFVVYKSHRFDNLLASIIKPLSANQITLSSEISDDKQAGRLQACSQKDGFQHCVIIFDNNTRDGVIKSFGDIVSEQFRDEYKSSEHFTVKALGAVGNEIDPEDQNQLKIGHYCSNYDKGKAKNTFMAKSLIEIVRYAQRNTTMDFHQYYKLLLGGIIKWLSLSEKVDDNGRTFNYSTIKDFLVEKGKWNLFRKIIHYLLTHDAKITPAQWEKICAKLKSMFDFGNVNEAAEQYMSYSETMQCKENFGGADSGNMVYLQENKLKHPDGFNIQLSTIHGVKGETHDATLIMETKYYSFDVSELLNHLSGSDNSRITKKKKRRFARQLYVAASRPRYLLCIALHSAHISRSQKVALTSMGWKIVTLPFVGGLNE